MFHVTFFLMFQLCLQGVLLQGAWHVHLLPLPEHQALTAGQHQQEGVCTHAHRLSR